MSRESYLPTISELRAFAACARTASTTRAAEELNLTQSAVSRSIGTLEDRLGVLLFHRARQRISLSEAGRAFLADAERLMAELNHASMAVMAFGGQGRVLRLAVLPTFGKVWLVPRLAAFRRLEPGITFDVTARLGPVDFEAEPFDAAIRRSDMRKAGSETMPLMPERLVVVAAPDMLAGQGVSSDHDLARLPLLQQTTRPSLWLDWFRDAGIDPRSVLRGARFDHFDMVVAAAVEGLGVAIVPEVLAASEIAEGRLALASQRRLVVGAPYALIYPQRSLDLPAFVSFRGWLGGAAAET